MNIEEIKKKANEAHYDGPVQDEIFFLLSIIEQAEKVLKRVYERDGYKFVDDVLKSIQGDE